MLERYQSKETTADENAAEEFYDELESAFGLETALKYDEIVGGLSATNHLDGFIKGFIYAMALMGKS